MIFVVLLISLMWIVERFLCSFPAVFKVGTESDASKARGRSRRQA